MTVFLSGFVPHISPPDSWSHLQFPASLYSLQAGVIQERTVEVLPQIRMAAEMAHNKHRRLFPANYRKPCRRLVRGHTVCGKQIEQTVPCCKNDGHLNSTRPVPTLCVAYWRRGWGVQIFKYAATIKIIQGLYR